MEKVDLPVHNHPLLPLTRFSHGRCKGCWSHGYIYGGYRCNDLCQVWFDTGYFCSICDFKLDLGCAWRPSPPLTLENTDTHEHHLVLSNGVGSELSQSTRNCKVCSSEVLEFKQYYECHQCELFFHVKCTKIYLDEYHTSHPEHPLKFLTGDETPGYADKKCLLCGVEFNQELHHCDVCNFSICRGCAGNPPPLSVMSSKTHEHQLHLFPRLVDFTCNACGTRDCIDLPRIININRHDHCISYTRRLGHGDWTCGVCREKVDGFHGAYSCSVASKCSSSYVVHSKCAIRKDVWDQIELEGTAEEEEVDDTTIKHFSHEHFLRLIEDGRILQENKLCEACVFQIQSESFYSCEQCDYILHEKCANISQNNKRH
ncbi:BnaA09g09930D [Brassica napus]|uniref:BnaA09g09930D protein n=1 Tax=Brassica napus TaxID=3708 RepID=A0A078IHV7_BRANA|nr:BnaA09g09930D [Brassica napus]